MAKKKSEDPPPPMEELSMDDLDNVNGGWALGVYGSVSVINPIGNVGGQGGPASTGGYTAAIGLQSSFPYVTGGIYQTTGTGLSTGVSGGGSVGVFGSATNADGVFTGPSNQAGLGVDAFGKVGVEASTNSSGFTAGAGVGVGEGVAGVQLSSFQTNTTSLLDGHSSVDTHSPTVEQPVYDAMGNATGYTQSVPNPNYDGHSGDPQQGDTHSADPGSGDTHSADPSSGDTHSADPSSGDTHSADPTASGDTHSADPSSGDTHSADPSSGDTHSADPSSGDTHSTDNNDDGNYQGGFDNSGGEGGFDGGGGGDFA